MSVRRLTSSPARPMNSPNSPAFLRYTYPVTRKGCREMAVLRHVVGETLRAVRLRQRRTLREVSAAARVSLGYLSEIERGHKEPSSELLAAICDALDVPLSEVFLSVSDTLRRQARVAERALVLGAR